VGCLLAEKMVHSISRVKTVTMSTCEMLAASRIGKQIDRRDAQAHIDEQRDPQTSETRVPAGPHQVALRGGLKLLVLRGTRRTRQSAAPRSRRSGV